MPALTYTQKNAVLLCLRDAVFGVTLLLSSGALFQALLMALGLSERQVGMITSIAYFAQIAAIFAGLFLTDRIRRVIPVMTFLTFPMGLFFAGFAVYCGLQDRAGLFVFASAAVVLYHLLLGLRNIFDYKLPYLILHMKDYGTVLSVSGILLYAVGIGCSLLLKWLLDRNDYFTVMTPMLWICAAFAAAASFTQLLLRPHRTSIEGNADTTAPVISIWKLLRSSRFTVLALPNFLRGITTGIISCAALFAAYDYRMPASDLTLLTTAANTASLIGNLIFLFFSLRKSVRFPCLLGCAITVLFPLTVCFPSANSFLFLYFIIQIGQILANGTIPVLITQFVPYDEIGAYTSLRMMITNAGSAIGSAVVGMLIGVIPSVWFYIAAAVFQLICGVVYVVYHKKHKRVEFL